LGSRRNRVIANALIVIGVLLLLTGILMPYYKIPQRLTVEGPRIQYEPYTVSTYLVPPIDKGTPINLNFLSDKAGTTTILLAPFDTVDQSIDLPVVLHVSFSQTQKGLVFFASAPKTARYMLMITCYNSSSFRFRLDSVWSPFYQYRSATVFGIFVLLLGIVSVYYIEYAERKEEMFRKALSGLRDTNKIRSN
jgi:hypothetical protein